ncbi:MAG: prolyl oligopeptidase family serine peptidase [Pseudonocardia sp.]|nr:prolyl oligopeptidase family serine peptidase [Pseudonocardia sp.]
MAHRSRLLTGLGIGAGAGLGLGLGIGTYYATVLLDTRRSELYPERVLSSGDGTVTLARSRLVLQPGVWGLRWPDGLAVLGPVLRDDRHGVVRRVSAGPVPPVGPAVVDAGPFDPDPGAHGLSFTEVTVDTPLGPAPAWEIPAPGSTWAISVHGRASSRREALRIVPALHALGLPQLVISYRNDPEAPPSPDGRFHLGDTEWEDLEAAVRYAVSRGARRIVLVGWSMGAAVSGAFLDRSTEAHLVDAVVWDAPLVDWRACLRLQAANRLVPPALVPLATATVTRRIGVDFDRFDLRRNPPAHRPPTFIVHSGPDSAVPAGSSRALAAAGREIGWPIRYLEVPGVEHTASWNADPARYERAVSDFLRDVGIA